MNVSLSFIALDIESFTAALAAMAQYNVPTASAVLSAPVTAPTRAQAATEDDKGTYETLLNAQGKRIRFSAEAEAKHGTREAYCLAILRSDYPQALPVSVEPDTTSAQHVAEFEAQEESQQGKSYSFDFEG